MASYQKWPQLSFISRGMVARAVEMKGTLFSTGHEESQMRKARAEAESKNYVPQKHPRKLDRTF